MILTHHRIRIFIIIALAGGITFLHYITTQSQHHYYIFYRELYFLPIILASFYFGLRGGLATSLTITGIYLSFTQQHWQGFSPDDFDKILEMVLFNIAALVLGKLTDRERANQKRLQEAKSLAEVGKAVSEIAHDMKTPLMAIGGFISLAARKLHSEDPNLRKLKIAIQETARLDSMVKGMLDFSGPLELDKSKECVEEIVEEMMQSRVSERSTRVIDHDGDSSMEEKKREGYF